MNTHWISTKDRLPTQNGLYIIVQLGFGYNKNVPTVKTARFIDNLKKLIDFRFCGKEFDRPGFYNGDSEGDWCENNVTYWMPLPNLPEEYRKEST